MKRAFVLFSFSLFLAASAQARIYIYVDAEGRKGATDRRAAVPADAKITSVMEGGGTEEASPKSSGTRTRTPSPASFPRIDNNTQKKRDDLRRNILEEELVGEQKNLDEAKRQLAVGQKLLSGEKAESPSYQARVKQLKSSVERHERNIAAIQKELGTIK